MKTVLATILFSIPCSGLFAIEPGQCTVVVEYISYDPRKLEKLTIKDTPGQELAIKLQPSTVAVIRN